MVMRLFAPQFLLVWAFIASAVAVHFRGKVRLGFWRQASDHSTIMAPYKRMKAWNKRAYYLVKYSFVIARSVSSEDPHCFGGDTLDCSLRSQ